MPQFLHKIQKLARKLNKPFIKESKISPLKPKMAQKAIGLVNKGNACFIMNGEWTKLAFYKVWFAQSPKRPKET